MADREKFPTSKRFRAVPIPACLGRNSNLPDGKEYLADTIELLGLNKSKGKANWAKEETLFRNMRLLLSLKKNKTQVPSRVFSRHVKFGTLGLWKLELCNLASVSLSG